MPGQADKLDKDPKPIKWHPDILKKRPVIITNPDGSYTAKVEGLPPELWGTASTPELAESICWQRRLAVIRKDHPNPFYPNRGKKHDEELGENPEPRIGTVERE